jgi:hypothetical protein
MTLAVKISLQRAPLIGRISFLATPALQAAVWEGGVVGARCTASHIRGGRRTSPVEPRSYHMTSVYYV